MRPAPSTSGPSGTMDPGEYRSLVARVRSVVEVALPRRATVAVVSRGDDDLLALGARRALHYPQDEDGRWAGYHPADDAAAIAYLDEVRDGGAEYLVFPATAFWWLDHYEGLRRHLETQHRLVVRQERTCLVYAVSGVPEVAIGRPAETAPAVAAAEEPATADPAESANGTVSEQLREMACALLPPAAAVVVAAPGDEDPLALPDRETVRFPRSEDAHADDAGAGAVRELGSLLGGGAEFLVVPRAASEWLGERTALADHLATEHRLITRQRHVGEIYELVPPRAGPTPEPRLEAGPRWQD
jgi:hypothetical protein